MRLQSFYQIFQRARGVADGEKSGNTVIIRSRLVRVRATPTLIQPALLSATMAEAAIFVAFFGSPSKKPA
jgi:hypothetical protein